MKIKILKKNILKENCGDPAAPESMMGAADVASMSPEAAFDAGYSAAIDEISCHAGRDAAWWRSCRH